MTESSRNHAPVLEKMFQFLLWLIPAVEKFPRTQKFLLGDRIQTAALDVQATHAPAACERRALDGVAVSCEAMKRDGVKRLRQRSGHTRIGAKAEGSFIAFCALSDTSAIALAGGLRFILQDA